MRLQLIVTGFVFPALLVALGQLLRAGLGEVDDRGDQTDQLVGAVAAGDLVLDHPHEAGLALIDVDALAGGVSSRSRATPRIFGSITRAR